MDDGDKYGGHGNGGTAITGDDRRSEHTGLSGGSGGSRTQATRSTLRTQSTLGGGGGGGDANADADGDAKSRFTLNTAGSSTFGAPTGSVTSSVAQPPAVGSIITLDSDAAKPQLHKWQAMLPPRTLGNFMSGGAAADVDALAPLASPPPPPSLPQLHAAAQAAMEAAMRDAAQGAAQGTCSLGGGAKDTDVADAARSFQASLDAAAAAAAANAPGGQGATPTDARLTDASVAAAARTYAALPALGRNLLRALADVRAKAVEVASACAARADAAQLAATQRMWACARWLADDAYRQAQSLEARRGAWQAAVDAGLVPRVRTLTAAVDTFAAAWTRAARQYATMLQQACGDAVVAPALHVQTLLQMVNVDAPLANAGTGGASLDAIAARLEALRRGVAYVQDTWAERDGALREACKAARSGATSDVPDVSVAVQASSAATAALARAEAAIDAARARVVDAQRRQFASLAQGSDVSSDGVALAAQLAAANAASAAAEAELDALYAARDKARAAVAAAEAQLGSVRTAARGAAAAVAVEQHGQWQAAAARAAADLAKLDAECGALRVQQRQLQDAVEKEVQAEHSRLLAHTTAAFAACAATLRATGAQCAQVLAAQRDAALAPLDAAERVLASQLLGGDSSSGTCSAGGGLAVASPPAFMLVDSVMRGAVDDRLRRDAAATMATHVNALTPLPSALASLRRPVGAQP